MPLPPRNPLLQAEKAFDFFQSAYLTQSAFLMAEFQQCTGYNRKTIKKYLRYKWQWFLIQQPDRTYCVLAIFAYVEREEFLAAHSQAWDGGNILRKKKAIEDQEQVIRRQQGKTTKTVATPSESCLTLTTEQWLLFLVVMLALAVKSYVVRWIAKRSN
jgi:hypothetical protein